MDLLFFLFQIDALMLYGFPPVTLAILYWQKKGAMDNYSIQTAINSNNLLLLLLNILVLLTNAITYLFSWYSQVSYEQDAYNFNGGNRYQMIVFVCSGIFYHFLPFIMLSKSIRKKMTGSLLILCAWISLFIVQLIAFENSIKEVLKTVFHFNVFSKIICYIILFNALYFLLKRKNTPAKTPHH